MSDLVKFVASVLKDGGPLSEALEEENKALRVQLEALQNSRKKVLGRVEITGAGGSPLYAFADVADMQQIDVIDNFAREVNLDNPNPGLCKISAMLDAEIRLSGVLIASLGEFNYLYSDGPYMGEENERMYFDFYSATHRLPAWEGCTISVLVHPNWLPGRIREFMDIKELNDEEIRGVRFEYFQVVDYRE